MSGSKTVADEQVEQELNRRLAQKIVDGVPGLEQAIAEREGQLAKWREFAKEDIDFRANGTSLSEIEKMASEMHGEGWLPGKAAQEIVKLKQAITKRYILASVMRGKIDDLVKENFSDIVSSDRIEELSAKARDAVEDANVSEDGRVLIM